MVAMVVVVGGGLMMDASKGRPAAWLVVAAAVVATGWPAGLAALSLPSWPFQAIALALGSLRHVSAGLPSRETLVRRPLASLLVVATAVFSLSSVRGGLVAGSVLVPAWILATAHWTLLAWGAALGVEGPAGSERRDRAALVPLLLLPTVLLSLAGHHPALPGTSTLALVAGALLAGLVTGSTSQSLAAAGLAARCPAGALAVVPLVALLPGLMRLGPSEATTLILDLGHGSRLLADGGLVRDDPRAEPPPGMGSFVALARGAGWRVRAVKGPLDASSLAGPAVIVTAMNHRPHGPAERAAILAAVYGGCGLLVVGDHTDVEGTSSAVGPLLADLGARLGFDTVWRRTEGALPDVTVLPHPLTEGMRRLYFSAGCSLDLSSPAWKPLVVADGTLFADGGRPDADFRLGDGVAGPGERMGGLVLAAARPYGLGRVVLLGDSAWLLNGVIPANAHVARRLLAWLGRTERSPLLAALGGACAVAMTLCVGALLVLHRRRPWVTAPLLLAGMALAVVVASMGAAVAAGRDRMPLRRPEVLVDLAHGNRCPFFWSSPGAGTETLDRVLREVGARGFSPVFLEPGDGPLTPRRLERAVALIVVAPRRSFEAAEVGAVDAWVRNGGRCGVLVGPGGAEAVASLLAPFGMGAESDPLGIHEPMLFAGLLPVELPWGDAPFPEAQVVTGSGVTDLATVVPVDPVEVRGGRPVLTALGRPLMAVADAGRGRVLVLGDARHFIDGALADPDGGVDEARLRFLGQVLAWLGVE